MDSPVHPPPDECYRAGDLLIEVGKRRISRDGSGVPLPGLSFDLLVALTRAWPRVLSMDELMDSVWAPAVVSPETVSQRVKLIRHALGDDPRQPRYIVGIRGRGYRLEAQVLRVPPDVPTTDPTAIGASQPEGALAPIALTSRHSPTLPAGSLWRRTALPLLAVLLLLLAAGAFLWYGAAGRKPSDGSASAPGRSIAVLPFIDMSEHGDHEYFADGITEEIIERLAHISQLHVPARTSSFYFKGKRVPVSDIARNLGVDNILEGSVRTSGDRIKVTAQLIRADTGYHLWSATYDRRIDDTFVTQEEIAAAVVSALKVSLLHAAPHGIPTSSTEAYTLYVQARALRSRGTAADTERAIEYLHRATGLDPGFASAWALLADRLTAATAAYGSRPIATAGPEARAAATKALALAPDQVDAHVAMARVFWDIDWDVSAAATEVMQAQAIDQGDSEVRHIALQLARSRGDFRRELELAQGILLGDPLNTWSYWNLAEAYLALGNLPEAISAMRKTLELNAAASDLHSELAAMLLSAGDAAAAYAENELETDLAERAIMRPLFLYATGRTKEAGRELAAAEAKSGDVAAYEFALTYAQRGERQQALTWLERAYRSHSYGTPYINADPLLASLRGEPRYRALRRRLNLPD